VRRRPDESSVIGGTWEKTERQATSKERLMMRAMFTAVSFAFPSPSPKFNSMAAMNIFTKSVCNTNIVIEPLRLAGLWDSVRTALF
jgi:hypothetical protein